MQKFTGLEYILIDMANNYGLDKETWDFRLAWAKSIVGCQTKIDKAIEKAEEQMLFIKAIYAYNDAINGVPTGFIMGLDATNSGLQIMSCVSGCHKTAEHTNLIPNGKRNSAYHMVAGVMDIEGITGKDVKYPLMTHYYNSTNKPKEILGEDTPELAAFYATLKQEFPGAEDVRNDCQAMWNEDAEYHAWQAPDGHWAYVRVGEYEEKKIEVAELDKCTFTHRAKTYKPSKFGLSLPANIIHSLDGWVVREMRKRCYQSGFEMLAVHDQFWCSPNHMNTLRQHYIDIMVWICEHDVLSTILSQIAGTEIKYNKLTNNLAELIKDAEYALS